MIDVNLTMLWVQMRTKRIEDVAFKKCLGQVYLISC